jgi:hypothetical protein
MPATVNSYRDSSPVDDLSNVVFMFGLNVDVDGVFDDKGRVIATTIAVDGDDQEVTEMVAAGSHPTGSRSLPVCGRERPAMARPAY